MTKKISRRDFLDGVAKGAGVAAITLSPLMHLSFSKVPEAEKPDLNIPFNYYPPAKTGLRGNVPGTFTDAHRLMRGEEPFDVPTQNQISENYDLVIVGAGISGLAAAHFYREKHPNDTILLLDNSADFGGHCVRNEFETDKGMMMSYAGSESLQSPRLVYSPVATQFLKDLTIDLDQLENSFNVNLYPDLGLSKGVYFDKNHWGVNKIVSGNPEHEVADDIPINKLNGRSYQEFFADFPMEESDKAALIALYAEPKDYLKGMSIEQKTEYLKTNSYLTFLKDKVKLSDTAIKYLKQQTTEFQGVGIDAVSGLAARYNACPGLEGMELPPLSGDALAELNDLYVYHFPDGNASVARLAVRKLIPDIASGNDMHDIVLSQFDYQKLDQADSKTRIRLQATAILAENVGKQADVVYAHKDKLYRVRANNVIMANYNGMIPYMVPSMPEAQRQALSKNVRVPFVYAKVMIKNWEVFKKLGVHKIYSPTASFSLVKLDYPVSMGGYKHSAAPQDPMCLHMVHVPVPGDGRSPRDQSREGRKKIVRQKFEDFESMIREQLDGMFGEHGFNHEEMITAITVNRWGHGYSYFESDLFDDSNEVKEIMKTARQPFGNIFIANSDSEWSAYLHAAVDAAHRAVSEIDA